MSKEDRTGGDGREKATMIDDDQEMIKSIDISAMDPDHEMSASKNLNEGTSDLGREIEDEDAGEIPETENREDSGDEQEEYQEAGGSSTNPSMADLFPEAFSFFRALGGGGFNNGEMTVLNDLMENLSSEESPFVVLEILNEISDRLLMINSLTERGLQATKLSKILIGILNNPLFASELEIQLVASRCVYNLLEVNPEYSHVLINCGVLEALKPKLMEISSIDLAEQVLQTLESLSKSKGRRLLKSNCLMPCLQYLDFFTIHAQRKGVIIVANSCHDVGKDSFEIVKEIFPILINIVTGYLDLIMIENSLKAISEIIFSFKNSPELLEKLVDLDLIKRVVQLVGNTSENNSAVIINANISNQLLSALALVMSGSPRISIMFVENCLINDFFNQSISIESLMKTSKQFLIKLLNLTCSLLPILANEDVQNTGYYSELNEKMLEINSNRIALYKEHDLNPFADKLLPLLINLYHSTVDFEIRRRILIALLRLNAFKKFHNKLEITNLLTTVIQKNINNINNNILLLGGLSFIQLNLIDEYREDFKREGLTSSLNDLLELVNGAIKEHSKEVPEVPEVPEEYPEVAPTESFLDPEVGEDRVVVADEAAEGEEENADGEEENDEDEDDDDEDEEDEDEDEENPFVYRRFINHDSHLIDASINGNLNLSLLNNYQVLTLIQEILISITDSLNTTGEVPAEISPSTKLHKEIINRLNSDLVNRFSYFDWLSVWQKLSQSINYNGTIISSFELTNSGIIPALIHLFNHGPGQLGSNCYNSFVAFFFYQQKDQAIITFIGKLQEALTRAESFEILTSGASDAGNSLLLNYGNGYISQSNNNNAITMARQIKIKLVDDDTTGPQFYKSIMLSTQAIATFKSIRGFLNGRFNMFNKLRLRLMRNSDEEEVVPSEQEDQEDEEPAEVAPGNFDEVLQEVEDNHEDQVDSDEESEQSPVSIEEIRKTNTSEESDFHFYIDNQLIPNDTTIYGAIFKSLQLKSPNGKVRTEDIWNQPHTVRFKNVGKPVEQDKIEKLDYGVSQELEDNLTINILKLLKVLFTMNFHNINESVFLNWKLTAKLNRQLEEPLIVVSGTLPWWSIKVTREFPFIFPINTRLFFLQSTSFGYSRLIQQWKLRANEDGSSLSELGRPNRHKIKISRKHMLQSGVKLLDLYGNHPSVLEIEYFNEEGSGLGPTLEFFSSLSLELNKSSLNIWRDEYTGEFVSNKHGLFPRPIQNPDKKVIKLFRIIGKLLARSLLDNRLVDFQFNRMFFDLAKLLQHQPRIADIPRGILLDKVAVVDPDLSNSLVNLSRMTLKIEDLCINFTLPGDNIELVEDGENVIVNNSNVFQYIDLVIDCTIGAGIYKQMEAFINGFSEVFPYSAITIFTSDELVGLFGNNEEDWSYSTLYSSIQANHGYNIDSSTVQLLLEILSEFTLDQRRSFLQFITGSPKLPIGGFKALNPELTIVRKPSENGLSPDDYLPSVMTCANYLKLPEYSSKAKMKERILTSIQEGLGAFLLS